MARKRQTPEVHRSPESDRIASSSLNPLLEWRRRTGNTTAARLLSNRAALERPGSPREREAQDSVRQQTSLRWRAGDQMNPGIARLGGGQPLPPALREELEHQYARPLDGIRVHTDAHSADTAAALHARALTMGDDIVFASGKFAPGTSAGRDLISHEVAHSVQQSADPASSPTAAMQPETDATGSLTSSLPPFHIPALGTTLFPGPLRPGVLGSPFPLPASLRLTNALSAGGSAPTYVLDLDPRQFVAHILDEIELSSSVRPGTPPGAENVLANRQRLVLRHTLLRFDPQARRLRGSAVLLVGSEYPESLKAPTAIDVTIESNELGTVTGDLRYGPLHSEIRLQLRYDTSRLEAAASPVFAPQGGFAGFWSGLQAILHRSAPGLQLNDSLAGSLRSMINEVLDGRVNASQFATQAAALVIGSIPAGADLHALETAFRELAEEFRHPGLEITGSVGLGPLPLSRFSVRAPTTRPIAGGALLGAPAPFPITIAAGGVILAPPGAIASVTVPALGGTYSRFGERSGFAATGGLLPSISTEAISSGAPLVRQFPVYAFADISYVRRVTNTFDFGIRLSAQFSTPDFAGREVTPTDTAARYDALRLQYLQAARPGTQQTAPLPTVGLGLFGRF